MIIVESLQSNLFYQMPYQSRYIANSEATRKLIWTFLPTVKLSSKDFMIEMFVRQKTKYPCSNLYNLPDGEFLRIGHDFNSQSKFLTFNKKSGDQMSLSFNGFKNNTDHFVFREVSMFFR